jgi:HAD superfamily hydrolase (TIGR01549 family)
MAERRFQAVILDLFGTLVEWNPQWLPTFRWGGRVLPSTIPLLIPKLRAALGEQFDLDNFVTAYNAVLSEIAHQRERDATEVTCDERFLRTLRRIKPDGGRALGALAEELTLTHMEAVRAATFTPAAHADLVRQLSSRYRLGLLSNFDEARTGRRIVADTGVLPLFEVVIISAEVGLRKPNPQIFALALNALKLRPDEVLFVGDTPYDDVLGARRAGIPVAWLTRGKEASFEDQEQPDFILRELAELPALLARLDSSGP